MTALQNIHYPFVEWVGSLVGLMARNARNRRLRCELDALPPRERSAIAADLGISERQLRNLAVADKAFPKLLKQMLAALNLVDAEVSADPMLKRDMQIVCSVCDHKRRCGRELRAGRAAVRFPTFCPNASNLESLLAAKNAS